MHFSSMAVSVLAQSLPLLAVGHLDGWKTREKRSWLQRRRLRDALLRGVHGKKDLQFKKRLGAFGKQGNVLEKKRSGPARLLQDSALRGIPSDDRQASVECDPLSKVTDSGIFSCGMDSLCVESEESEMGGFCIATQQAPSISREMQVATVGCVEGLNEDGYTCDCSLFNNTTGVGSFTCTGEYCVEMACFNIDHSASYNADGSYIFGGCYKVNGDLSVMELNSYCFSVTSNLISSECEIKANDVVCNSCEFNMEICPDATEETLVSVIDCSNTVMNFQGNDCDGSAFTNVLLLVESAETADPSETGAPSEEGSGTMAPFDETV